MTWPGAAPRHVLAAAAVLLTALSVAVFAAVSACGDPAIVAPIGAAGPFVDLHHTLTPAMMKAVCWVAAVTGGAGVTAGLAAVRRGWRPRSGLILAACAVATVVFVFVPPAASVDVQNYAEYGRIVVLGHNPWVMTPQRLHELRDPVGLLAPPQWRGQPTVYGPVATVLEAAAALLGGASMAWIAFWIKLTNGVCYLATAVVLDRLARPDPVRRARAALLWAVNPLMLFWMVAGAHTDLLAVLPLLLALLAARRARGTGRSTALAAGMSGVLAGIAIAVKVTFAGPAAGLAAGLAVGRRGAGQHGGVSLGAWLAGGTRGARRHGGVSLGAWLAGAALVLAGGYAVAGLAAVKSLSQRLSSANDSFLPLPGAVYLHPALYTAVTVAAVGIVGGVLARRLPPAQAGLPETRPMLVCALAVVLGGIVQYPWYDSMFFPLLALLPATRLDGWLVGRITVISGLLLPGVGITVFQYREVRVAAPVFLVLFLAAAARGRLTAGYVQDGRPGERTVQPASAQAAASSVQRASTSTGRATTDFSAAGSMDR